MHILRLSLQRQSTVINPYLHDEVHNMSWQSITSKRFLTALPLAIFLLTLGLSDRQLSAHPLPSPAQGLDAVFGPGVQGTSGGVPRGADLFRIDVDTANPLYTNAVCNDGTAAVFYVRSAQRNEDANRWQIHLQGGGSCKDGTSCAKRWLSADTNMGAHKMSNQFAPADGIAGNGILSPGAGNQFRGWNHVYLYYCSSDSWQGRQSNVVLETTWFQGTQPSHNPQQYLIHFRGADIIDAVIDMLRNGAQYVDQRERTITMPDLDEAERILLTGSSAGSGGVRYNTDRIRALLQAGNEDLDFRAVVDAGYSRPYPTRDYRRTPMCQLQALCSYELMMSNEWHNVKEALHADPATPGISVEDDCETTEAGTNTEWKCADGVYVLENHIATPVFVRQDLQDSLVAGNYEKVNFGSAGDFGQLVAYELERFHAADTSRGVFAPQCGDHTGLTNNRFSQAMVDVGGTLFSFHDLLLNWVNGSSPTVAIETFQGPGAAPNCP